MIVKDVAHLEARARRETDLGTERRGVRSILAPTNIKKPREKKLENRILGEPRLQVATAGPFLLTASLDR